MNQQKKLHKMINDKYYTIETSEFPTGVLDDYYLKKVIKRNQEPNFDTTQKYYDFVKVLRSTTVVIAWLFKMDGNFYVALYSYLHGLDYCISFYKSDRRGTIDNLDPICVYRSYVDIESACDRFATEYIAMQINNKNESFINIINNEEFIS